MPRLPLPLYDDLRAEAERLLEPSAFGYYVAGAGAERALARNEAAWAEATLRHRVLVDVSRVDTSVELLGKRHATPLLVAPTALQRMAHADGETGTARACARAGVPMVLSTLASTTLEDVAAGSLVTGSPTTATESPAAAAGTRWFQLYIHRDRGLTRELVERAVAAGYEAIVLTVDAPQLGHRLRDERNGFSAPPGIGLANLVARMPPGVVGESGLFAYFAGEVDPSVRWEDLAWLRTLSHLPLLLKGVVHPDDAARAVTEGVDGVWVSNHGGRQLDGDIATAHALPAIAEAVGGKVPIVVDGGIRRGEDVIAALCLGASAVALGRPILWALACGGEAMVFAFLERLAADVVHAMKLLGCPRVADLGPHYLTPTART